MNKRLISILTLGLLLFVTGCKPAEDLPDAKRVGLDRIERIALYPSSPVLIADGQATLSFEVECYYTLDEDKNHKEYVLPEDRIPYDKISIVSAAGESFNAQEGYRSTNPAAGKVTFTATMGDITSAPCEVTLYAPLAQPLPKQEIPLRFVALYEKENKSVRDNLTEELLRKQVDRLNQSYSGSRAVTANGVNTGLHFVFDGLEELAYEKMPAGKHGLPEEVESHMGDWQSVVYVWIYDGRTDMLYDFVPEFTTGDPKDLPGLKLDVFGEDSEISPESVGTCVTYQDVYHDDDPFSRPIGTYYGLLETGGWIDDLGDMVNGDSDFCPDTYTYDKDDAMFKKRTLVPKGERYVVYHSTNIMDENTTSACVSMDQAKRIHQVLKDVPQRKQGKPMP